MTPKYEEQERHLFRERLKSALADRAWSGRALERELNLGAGTLTRLYNGRKALDAELLVAIATALHVLPRTLVWGTAMSSLLQDQAAPPPGTPEPTPAPAARSHLPTGIAAAPVVEEPPSLAEPAVIEPPPPVQWVPDPRAARPPPTALLVGAAVAVFVVGVAIGVLTAPTPVDTSPVDPRDSVKVDGYLFEDPAPAP